MTHPDTDVRRPSRTPARPPARPPPAPPPHGRARARPAARAAAATLAATALLGGLATAPAASAAAAPASATTAASSTAAPAAAVGNVELVTRRYEDFLGRRCSRASSDPGRLHWARQLDAGTPRDQVLAELTRTPEFARTAVAEVYLRVLGRAPDPGARYWIDDVPRGMAVEWVEQNALASLGRTGIQADAPWVAGLHPEILGRPARPGEPTYWAQRVPELGALGVVRETWYSPEGVGGRIADSCAELLGRSASPGEIDRWRAAEARSDLDTRVAIASSDEYAEPFTAADAGTRLRASFVEDFLVEVHAGAWRAALDRLSPQARAAVAREPRAGRRGADHAERGPAA